MSIDAGTKSGRGRPATGKGTQIGVRLQPNVLAALDRWREAQPAPQPSRAMALRLLAEATLKQKARHD